MRRLRSGVVSAGYHTAWRAVGHLPDRAAAALFDRVADIATARRGPAVVQLARNMRRVLGPRADPGALHALVRAAMRSYARYWRETFRLERADLSQVARRALADTVGVDHVHRALARGRGVVLALPHSGNWDVAGVSMVHLFGRITTVAERVEPASLFRRFVAYRERLGFEVLPLTDDAGRSGPSARILRERLRSGGVVCLMADRDLDGRGVPVTFFGEPTTMPAGPALLAASTGAALCPGHLAYTDDGWLQHIGAPLDLSGGRLAQQVRDGTQQLADAFAERIGLFPADWHMLQPVWPDDQGPR